MGASLDELEATYRSSLPRFRRVAAAIVGDREGACLRRRPGGVREGDQEAKELSRLGANVPVTDNVYAFQAPRAVPTKLVAYDAQHRVVAIYML